MYEGRHSSFEKGKTPVTWVKLLAVALKDEVAKGYLLTKKNI
jgi:hypothetical protein